MKIPLKLLLPLLALATGMILISAETLIQMNSENKKVYERTMRQVKVVGNRLASRTSIEFGDDPLFRQNMTTISAPYMADSLDKIQIFSQDMKEVFKAKVGHHEDTDVAFNSERAKKVMQNQFAYIEYIDALKHITAYFPLDLKIKKDALHFGHQGVMYLVFDVSVEYEYSRQSIIENFVMNIIFMSSMVILFSSFIYFFVFKRINALHKATKKMTSGDFSVQIENSGEDELSEVINTFNDMAKKMNTYKYSMQEQVERAVKERTEQSKILIQQSRLASMGEMIGNIAHQWRQPLNALSLVIQKLLIFSQRGKLTEELVEENAKRAKFLIQNMSQTIDDFRDFFKPIKEKEYFYLKDAIANVIELLGAGFIHLEIELIVEVEPWCEIYGFKNEFTQVIVNLLTNSKDAFKENNISSAKIIMKGYTYEGKVFFTVSDNAGGIPVDIISRIFEPYYTTKEEGKGTGIGLYMSKMIIEENMNGMIDVYNLPQGAEFSMIFVDKKGKK